MNNSAELSTLWTFLDNITNNLKSQRLADVFRFISFYPFETYGPHKHLRIEINHVKKGNLYMDIINRYPTFLSLGKVTKQLRAHQLPMFRILIPIKTLTVKPL